MKLVLAIFINLTFMGELMAKQFNVMLFTKTNAWHHESILDGVTAIKKLAEKHHFDLEWHEDPNQFNEENLNRFDAIVFLSTSGDVFNHTQKQAFKQFIQRGKGFVGIHSASDTEHNWTWYTKLVGRRFIVHPEIQTAKLDLVNHDFPGLSWFPKNQLWTDEWYEFGPELSNKLNYLLAVDETSYEPRANMGDVIGHGMGNFHPIAWYQYYDGGRSFYTALGHTSAVYRNSYFLDHLFGGIYWAATAK
ncbi:ThuA domain-containing protein [Catenovulum maritimum]|uniref:Crp/Fnr family transcriptional regulator n=1 Tax=Catenovulum maritimum TaxID=1513271 RepID=A0A0J8GS62_9ALTE|nr:ThuA domain-containing protein [Catenovulum maritimum]KMT64139.1 Crp/Fnr family transcriptional regulator [Catenovulum maritimum]